MAFDAERRPSRTEMYADYKGGRASLRMSFVSNFIRELLDLTMGIRHYELASMRR